MEDPKFSPKEEVLIKAIITRVLICDDGFTRYEVKPKYYPLDTSTLIVEEANVFKEKK